MRARSCEDWEWTLSKGAYTLERFHTDGYGIHDSRLDDELITTLRGAGADAGAEVGLKQQQC